MKGTDWWFIRRLLFLLLHLFQATTASAFLLDSAQRAFSRSSGRNVQFKMAMLPETSLLLTDPSADSQVAQLSKETTIVVFVVGVIPFAIATFEFWRRIAVGASFGTNDPVVFIGEDNAPSSSRGKQVLGRDSLITAYIIFAVVIAVLGLVVFSVVTSPDPDLVRNALTSSKE